MSQRLSVSEVDPRAYQAVLGLERYVRGSGLDKPLCEPAQQARISVGST
jgi:hypothetical protein